MNARRKNIQRLNEIRSARVTAMTEFLQHLDSCGANEIGYLGVADGGILKGEINSYRAMKISRFFGVKISKTVAVRFSKSKTYDYKLTASQVMDYITSNREEFYNYWEWYRQPAILSVEKKYKNLP